MNHQSRQNKLPGVAALPNRREALHRMSHGFGSLALAALLADETRAAPSPPVAPAESNPLSLKPPHFPPKAKRVIFLFMAGGPPHTDTFDPKPRLQKDNGKPLPLDVSKLALGKQPGNLLASPFKFAKHGQSGLDVSELFPNIATCVDDLCVIRSLAHEDSSHVGGHCMINTGERLFSRPSMGAWITYGLGTENQDLPGFVAIGPQQPELGVSEYGSAFLPAAYQGIFISDMENPIRNLRNSPLSLKEQRQGLNLLGELNRLHRDSRSDDSRLNARIESFELAYRMQAQAPGAFDLSKESDATRRLYGIGTEPTDIFGRQCLLARRLVERGVRFVQVFDTQGLIRNWDAHSDIRTWIPPHAKRTDLPIAGLLKDLKSRGLLADTLVLWGGEFGRTPTSQGSTGRDHHPYGYTMWLAGGGVKSGLAYGATDEFGWYALPDNRVHIHDLHATILHLLGLDHKRLTYRYAGRNFRLTDVSGHVVKNIIA